MADGESTPKKVYDRNSVCRLCGGTYECRHMLRVFSKSGIEKDLCAKVQKTCGIQIAEDDYSSKLICRKCEAFVSKMNDFRQRSQNIQIELEQQCSVKRCVELSPSSKQPSKRSATREPSTSAKQLAFNHTPVGAQNAEGTGNLSEFTRTEGLTSVILPKPLEGTYFAPLPETPELLINEGQKQKIIQAAKSKQAVVVADIIKKHCPSVLSALKMAIVEEINSACKNLCKRSDGSVLYGNSYENLKEFDFENVWNEMETNIPFVIDIMIAVSGKGGSIEDVKNELRVKFSFLYSVLMNERWHELSLLKRVNTILIIEGGCTKQV